MTVAADKKGDRPVFELIRILRMPLAFLVVLIHVSVPESWSTQAEQETIQFFRFFFLCPLAVPLFFLFSGLLFFRERELTRADYVRKLKSRVRTLLIPYLLFSLIGAGYIWGVKSFGFSRAAENPYDEIHNLWDFFVFICKDGGGIGPLWFLRHLFLVSLLSPLIYFLIKKIGVLLVLLLFSWMATDGGTIYSVSLFFWAAGAFIALSSTAPRVINCSFLPLLILYPISAAADYAFSDIAPWLHALNLAFGAMLAVSSAQMLPKVSASKLFRRISALPDASYFVYLTHFFLVGLATRIYGMTFPPVAGLLAFFVTGGGIPLLRHRFSSSQTPRAERA